MKNFHEDLYNKLIEKFELLTINNQIINEEINNSIQNIYSHTPQIFPLVNSLSKVDIDKISELYIISETNQKEVIEYFKEYMDYKKFIEAEKYGKIIYSPHVSLTILDLNLIFNKIRETHKNFYFFFNFRFFNFPKSNFISICFYNNQIIALIECTNNKHDVYKQKYAINFLLSIQLGCHVIFFNNTSNIMTNLENIINNPNRGYVIALSEYNIYENMQQILLYYKGYYEEYVKHYKSR